MVEEVMGREGAGPLGVRWARWWAVRGNVRHLLGWIVVLGIGDYGGGFVMLAT